VNSLQPALKWEGGTVSNKHDLAIWNSFLIDSGSGKPIPQRRKIIYEKTGLSGTSHKVEIVLEPNSTYFWSVRETGSETWTTESVFGLYETPGSGNIPGYIGFDTKVDMFRFQTPKAN
jgi:hypothetical protein